MYWFLVSLATCVASSVLCAGTGWIDTRLGHDTCLKHPCALFFWLALVSLIGVFVSLWVWGMSWFL